MIKRTKVKVRQRVAQIRLFKLAGSSSPQLRRTLFSSYVLPLFTWVYTLFPLLTEMQRKDLSRFSYTCLRSVMHCFHVNDTFFSYVFDEKSLEDRCAKYWEKYLHVLADSKDGLLLLEKANLNDSRTNWLKGYFPIKCLRRSKRFIANESILGKAIDWLSSIPAHTSLPAFEIDEIRLLQEFPETFLP
jgi:hypothetical protein